MSDTDKAVEQRLLDARFVSHVWDRWRRPEWPISWHNEEPDYITVSTEEALRIVRSECAASDAQMLNDLAAGALAGGCEVRNVRDVAVGAFDRLHGRKPEVLP